MGSKPSHLASSGSSRSVDNPFDDSHGDPFDDGHATPLENMPPARISTETQRRNGFRQSSAPTRGLRIIEDIRNGNEMCCICLEPVSFTSNRFLWHCRGCYAVTHSPCAVLWAKADRRGWNGGWKCPRCAVFQSTTPLGKCWCEKGTPIHDHPTTPNACRDGVCGSESTCPHQNKSFCAKPCHPGPCEYACGSCANDALPRPPDLNTIWGRFRSMPLNRGVILGHTICTLLVLAGVFTYVVFHIKWYTQPYFYPKARARLDGPLIFPLVLVVVLYFLLGGMVCFYYFCQVTTYFYELLNGSPAQRTQVKSKGAWTFLGLLSITCIFLAAYLLPIIGILGGSDIQWYHQMKDSCEGFDTRIVMGTRTPRSTYYLRSLDPSVDEQTFFLAPVFAPQVGSNEPYQYYHRFSGNSAHTAHLAVDVDIDKGAWRLVELDGPDERTAWYAIGRKYTDSPLPTFAHTNETERYNGTLEKRGTHLWLPEWEMVIQGIEDARRHHEIEPFIRVFDVQRAPDPGAYAQRLMQANWGWSPAWDEYVMMRTASFGHGRQRLDMCVRENYFLTEKGEEEKFRGVSDVSFVPLAIILSYRMRMAEMNILDAAWY
ncbi:hypothetical protein DSL72_008958 [Monilinia vaccinii-corymbosi]|uniref:Uncharacterized protein n=1 Tax=Monilinia vaccinii-corymbosi TaxID=61207 RepID=A0A8A3PQU0_9HELO|nr:hypothetical protein DSL72_008958 [Monilinia vaccinii-corymbosi]